MGVTIEDYLKAAGSDQFPTQNGQAGNKVEESESENTMTKKESESGVTITAIGHKY